ncbi:MAG: hypothetical protein ACYDDF_04550 [Thermoplasmatota archaeon]
MPIDASQERTLLWMVVASSCALVIMEVVAGADGVFLLRAIDATVGFGVAGRAWQAVRAPNPAGTASRLGAAGAVAGLGVMLLPALLIIAGLRDGLGGAIDDRADVWLGAFIAAASLWLLIGSRHRLTVGPRHGRAPIERPLAT